MSAGIRGDAGCVRRGGDRCGGRAAGHQGEHAEHADLDARAGRDAPSARQRALVASGGLQATWNEFGTPQSLVATSGYLATGLDGDAVTAARQWVARNTELLGISASEAGDLELVSSAPVGRGRAVLLRQRFGGLPAGHDGLISVAVVAGRVAHVTSSLAPETGVTGARDLDA